MQTYVIVENNKVVGTTIFKELEGYKVLPAPEGFDGNLEKLTLENGQLKLLSEEEYLQIKKQEAIKEAKRKISQATDSYIQRKLAQIDEDLADITSEALLLEGRILTIAGGKISSDEVKEKIAQFLSGKYSREQAITELQEKQLSEEQITQILKTLQRAVEIAKILAWKENIWKVEETLEEALENKKLSELENLDVEQLVEKAYEKIPLEAE